MHSTRFLEESVSINEEGGFGGASEDGEEDELNEYVVTTTVVVAVLLLILLTIAFEEGKHKILHSADRNMKPIISSLFGEMTVLGFLSLFTFCVTQLGFFERLSMRLFGPDEHDGLLEIFEAVHFMLFGVMVFFVTTVLTLVHGARQTEEYWYLMDLACRRPDYIQRLADKINGSQRDGTENVPTWRSFLIGSLSTRAHFPTDLTLFWGIRTEFLLERSVVPPFDPAANNGIDDGFNFGRYLSICLGQTLSHVVEVDNQTWAFFGVVSLLYYCLLMLTSNNLHIFAWVWVGTGWGLILHRNYFDYHIWQVARAMAAPLPGSRRQNGIQESASLVPSSLPTWTKIEFHEKDRTSDGPHKLGAKRGTRQDSFYWRGRDGPRHYRFVFQIQLVFTSAYISLLLMTFYPHMYRETSGAEFVLFVVGSLLPFGLLLGSLRRSAAYMTVVSNIGAHRMPQTVAQVIREEKTARVVRSVILVQRLQLLAAAPPPPKGPLTMRGSYSPMSAGQTLELESAGKAFDAMDKSGDGHVRAGELKDLLRALGAPTTDQSTGSILRLLDADQDGAVSRDEFLDFYRRDILSSGEKKSKKAVDKEMKDLAGRIFRQLDRDRSGSMSLSEFKAIIESCNVGFTIDELGDLVNEIDEDNTGSIGEHEFVNLLDKHRSLFQTYHLPPLSE